MHFFPSEHRNNTAKHTPYAQYKEAQLEALLCRQLKEIVEV